MNKIFNIFKFALVAVFALSLSACSDDDDNIPAKAVLASVSNLQYDTESATPQIITVYSDAVWTCEHPDWVIVEPETGSGVTEVRITVTDNLRDGTPDNPRKADIVFKGITKTSEAHVVIRQDGDLYREVAPITIAQMEQNEDETVAIIKNLTVVGLLADGFIATDGTNNVKVNYSGAVANDETLTVYGQRASDANNMPVLAATKIEVGGTPATLPAAVDITGSIDTYVSKTRTYVEITGVADGSAIKVEGADNRGNVAVSVKGLNFSDYNGHNVIVRGFFAGTASPVVNIIAAEVEDLGVNEIIYYSEDFEWLAPWTTAAGAGDSVGDDDLNASSPAMTSAKAVDPLDNTEKTAMQAILDRGYVMLYDKNDNKRIYLNTNYLKMGKTGNHGGIQLKPISEIPAGENCILKFDWSGMRQGSGKIDPVNLYVNVINGSDVQRIDVPALGWADGHKLEWVKAEIDLSGMKIDANTKIQITQTQWEVATANRWFIDNIKIVKK